MKNNSDLVSIIIPVYNGVSYINDAIESVKRQTYSNWECIIINDGSTDGTEDVVLQSIRGDDRFVYRKQENKGLPGARNAALDICTGDFVQLLDADDALHPQKLEKHLALIKDKGLSKKDVIVSYSEYFYCHHENIYDTYPHSFNCRFFSDDPLKDIVLYWENKLSITPNAYFFSTTIFSEKKIRFDENILTCEDIDCWIRIFQLKPQLLFLEEKLAYYRVTPHSMSRNTEKVWKGHIQVMEKHMSLSTKGSPMYRWARYKKNEVLVRYRKFGKMDLKYKFYFIVPILVFYKKRLIEKLFKK